jgi:transposase
MQEVFIGVDVAKDWLDVHHPGRVALRLANTAIGLRAFATACAKEQLWINLKASGAMIACCAKLSRGRACASVE